MPLVYTSIINLKKKNYKIVCGYDTLYSHLCSYLQEKEVENSTPSS